MTGSLREPVVRSCRQHCESVKMVAVAGTISSTCRTLAAMICRSSVFMVRSARRTARSSQTLMLPAPAAYHASRCSSWVRVGAPGVGRFQTMA